MELVVFLAGVVASFPPIYFLVSRILDRHASRFRAKVEHHSDEPVAAFLDHLSSEVASRVEKLVVDVVNEARGMPATCDRIGDGLSTGTRTRLDELVKSIEALFGEPSARRIAARLRSLQAAAPSSREFIELSCREIREAMPKSIARRSVRACGKLQSRQARVASLSLGAAPAAPV